MRYIFSNNTEKEKTAGKTELWATSTVAEYTEYQ